MGTAEVSPSSTVDSDSSEKGRNGPEARKYVRLLQCFDENDLNVKRVREQVGVRSILHVMV